MKGSLPKTRAVVEEHGEAFPILLDSDSFSRDVLHVTNTPTVIIVDSNGRIRARLLGAVDNLREIINNVVERISS